MKNNPMQNETTVDTPWSKFRWAIALRIMRVAIGIAPAGDAKNRWGDYQRGWIKEVQAAWRFRYGE